MNKEIKKLENCLKAMKKCLKIPNVENCVCFSDAFKVLDWEVKDLDKQINQRHNGEARDKIISLKKEIDKIQRIISKDKKECLGCSPCIASVVFKAYPQKLDEVYLKDKL